MQPLFWPARQSSPFPAEDGRIGITPACNLERRENNERSYIRMSRKGNYTRNLAVADNPRDAFVQKLTQWRG